MPNIVVEATGTPLTTIKGLLTEPSRQNVCLAGDDISNVTYWAVGSATITATLLTPIAVLNVNAISQPYTSTAASWTISRRVKPNGYTKFGWRENTITGAYATFDCTGAGTVIATNLSTATIIALNDGSYWVTMTYTGAAVSVVIAHYVMDSGYASGAPHLYSYTGNGTSGMYLYNSQYELGATASSYIPTTTAAVTRAVEVDTIPSASNITAAAGTMYIEWTPNAIQTGDNIIAQSFVDASNYTALIYNSTGSMIVRKRIAAANNDATYAISAVVGTTYRIAGSWGAAGVLASVNGVSGTLNANTTNAQISATISIASVTGEVGSKKNLRPWTTQLTQAQLNALTK